MQAPPLQLPDGTPLPAIGLGTWRLGEAAGRHAAEITALRSAIGIGWRLIDTAEMYGDGGAEEVLARIGAARGLSAAQVALAWLLGLPGVLPIPKALNLQHLQDNLAAARVQLGSDERQQIQQHFAPPPHKTALAMI